MNRACEFEFARGCPRIKTTIDDIVEDFEKEATEDFIGLWQVVGVVEDNFEEGEDLRRLTFDVVRRMLARGFKAGRIAEGGRTLDAWRDQRPESIIGRLQAEWRHGDPNLEFGVCFDREQPA